MTKGNDSKEILSDLSSDYGSIKDTDTILSHVTQLPNTHDTAVTHSHGGTHGEGNKNSSPSVYKPTSENGTMSNGLTDSQRTTGNVSKTVESQGRAQSVHYTPTADGGNGDGDQSETMQLVTREGERELTNTEAILHLFKVFTGPSTIGMPSVIQNGGLVFGSIGFLFIGYLATYGNILVVNCGRILCRRTGKSSLRYEQLMEMAILSSFSDSKRTRQLATGVRRLTVIMLCMCQFGILAFYIQIIASIVQYEFDQQDVNYNLPMSVTKIFICIFLVPYSWMKNLKVLSWFSLLANVSIIVCVVTILQYACRNLQPVNEIPWIAQDPWNIPLFISASVFTVEGVPMLLPIENRVLNPDAYGGLCGVITLAATGNIIINMCLGFYGYLSFGNQTPGNVLTALPVHWWYDIITILYGLMVFLTFTLQLFLPAEFMVNALLPRIKHEWFQKYADIIVRTLFVLAAYLMTLIVSNIELIMSLTGALCSVPLLFLFPSAGELLLLYTEPKGISWYNWTKCGFVFAFGLLVTVTGTISSVVDIIAKLHEQS